MKKLAIALVIFAALLIPFRRLNCPEWDVVVVQPDGSPAQNARVEVTYQNFYAENDPHQVVLYSDSNGAVSFPRAYVRVNALRYLYGLVFSKHAFGYSNFRSYAWVTASDSNLRGNDERVWNGSRDHLQSTIKLNQARPIPSPF